MSYLLLLVSLLFVAGPADPDPTQTLSITSTAKVDLPADRIHFNININAEADTPQDAYQVHQQREDALVQLLEQYNIEEEDIQYQPISISQVRSYNRSEEDKKPTYQTSQAVTVTFSDFDSYEKIQIGLIENSFDDFSGSFAASDLKEGKDEALKKAIQKARDKAQLIADASGVTLGSVVNIRYNVQTPRPDIRIRGYQMKAASDSANLLQYEQTVTVSASISMEFEIQE